MIITKKYQTSVSLFHVSGVVQTFKSIDDALKQLGYGWISQNVGKHFVKPVENQGHYLPEEGVWVTCRYAYCRLCPPKPVYWVIRDDQGKPLDSEDFWPLVQAKRNRWRLFTKWGMRGWSLDTWNGEGPVPGIRKCRGGYRSYRAISHINERRAAQPMYEEGEVAPRGARNVHNLPDPWNDYVRQDTRNRGWKQQRKTQWKKGAVSYRTLTWEIEE